MSAFRPEAFLALIPIALGWAVVALHRWLVARAVRRALAAVPAPPEPAPPPAPTPAPAETLAARLHRLGQELAGPADDTGHPGELAGLAQFQAAVAALGAPEVPLATLRQLALGTNWAMACAALAVLAGHPERDSLCADVLARFDRMRPWTMLYALRFLAALEAPPPAGAPLARAPGWWAENAVIAECFAEYFALRAPEEPGWGEVLDQPRLGDLDHIATLLERIDHPSAGALLAGLRDWRGRRIDRRFLATIGRIRAEDPGDGLLVMPDAWRAAMAAALPAVTEAPHRSLLVTGEARVGKSAFLRLFALRLGTMGWTVFEASAAELMAGQSYVGELEGRIRQLMAELEVGRRIVWHVADLAQMAAAGTYKGQPASILDQILPAVAEGKLVLLAEAAPAVAARLLQSRPALRTLFEQARLEPMAAAPAAALAREVAGRIETEVGLAVAPGTVEAAMELAGQYLGQGQLPGTALDLLLRAAHRAGTEQAARLEPGTVLMALSQVTGLPRDILDASMRVDLAAMRRFFAARVIGQAEAVAAVVDRIAMLKAGLTDPGRPVGVFLFAGPTGTGKTELAKTLAEYLFGTPERMARLDMSEFQAPDSLAKILGRSGEGGDSLVERIRKEPFSVVLLDEFEKAHPNVWDLCLQLFDDGRLTDADGRVADFRHTIVILTSNLGATAHQGGMVGFMAAAQAYGEEQVRRAVGQTFRPEFVNRLDRIIVFRPLSRALMRDILRKELAAVLERRGLRGRGWAVEWEDSAIEFLLDRGFSPEMGARPLKRAIDQHLLAPLAATLVEQTAPAGEQFLFVRGNGRAIEVEFVDPDADPAPAAEAPASGVTLAGMILRPAGEVAERVALGARLAEIAALLDGEDWAARKEGLQAAMAAPGFWQREDRGRTLARLARMDRIAEAMRTAERLAARLAAVPAREIVTRLALQLHLVGMGIEDEIAGAPVDALLRVVPALEAGDAGTWCARLADMYRGWAGRRHMQIVEHPGRVLEIGGFGAWRTLAAEAGLHVLELGEDGRATARVQVVAGPPGEAGPGEVARLLAGAPLGKEIVRRYREGPSPLVRDAVHGWRSGKLEAVMAGDFDLVGKAV